MRSATADVVTMSIQKLLLQVWAWTDPADQDIPIPFPRDLDGALVHIWPGHRFERTWPPPVYFDDEGFMTLLNLLDRPIPSPILPADANS
jgi:hypothetical protein